MPLCENNNITTTTTTTTTVSKSQHAFAIEKLLGTPGPNSRGRPGASNRATGIKIVAPSGQTPYTRIKSLRWSSRTIQPVFILNLNHTHGAAQQPRSDSRGGQELCFRPLGTTVSHRNCTMYARIRFPPSLKLPAAVRQGISR